jgi:hypothetical protein
VQKLHFLICFLVGCFEGEINYGRLVSYVANSCFGRDPKLAATHILYTFTTLVPKRQTCASVLLLSLSLSTRKRDRIGPAWTLVGPYPCTTNLPLLDKPMCLILPSGLKASRPTPTNTYG